MFCRIRNVQFLETVYTSQQKNLPEKSKGSHAKKPPVSSAAETIMQTNMLKAHLGNGKLYILKGSSHNTGLMERPRSENIARLNSGCARMCIHLLIMEDF